MGWIKVGDRLPEHEEDVLAVFIGWDDIQYMEVLYYDEDCDIWFNGNGSEYKATHWMPLPDPPK